MDIHKPKPWHGVREFLKEIGTIVIGVLIALGAEQTVEWLHRQQEVAEAREALKEEMTRDLTWMQINIEETPCLQARLDRVAAWINGGPRPPFDAGSLANLESSTWDEARTSAVPHMPLKERIAYDQFYAWVADRQEVNRNKRATFGVLVRYSGYQQVPAEVRRQALEDVAAAKAQTNVLASGDRLMLAKAQKTGLTPRAFSPQSAARVAQLCDRAATAPPTGSALPMAGG
jgi:hypothetical protein